MHKYLVIFKGSYVKRRLATLAGMSLASILMAILAAANAQAQTHADVRCAGSKRLTLDKLTRLIQIPTEEQVVVYQIEACHVSFSLDAPSLEKLIKAGMTAAEFHALNPETAAGLTVEQAHAEVADLEAYSANPDPSLMAQRDAEIHKSDAEYQSARAKAAKVDPKGEFQSTAEYNKQVQQSQVAVAQLDRQHEAAVAQIKANYEAKAEARYKPFRERVEFLKQSEFAVTAATAYVGYNADTNRLTATIGGEEYWFDKVPAAMARQMKEGWKNVSVAQLYDEDSLKTQFLRLRSAGAEFPGISKRALVNRYLKEAAERLTRKDYENALVSYQELAGADPGNRAAKDGIEAIQREKSKDAETAAADSQEGFWRDLDTGLMWTLKDNGTGVSPQEAAQYCQGLRTGDFADWRLPTWLELRFVYDPSVTRETPPLTHSVTAYSESGMIAAGTVWRYHIKGGIILDGRIVLSSSPYEYGSEGQMKAQEFIEGGPYAVYTTYSREISRALCVRRFGATIAAGSSSPQLTIRSTGNIDPGTAQEAQQAETFYNQNHFREAFTLAAQSCEGGNHDGCAYTGAMFALGIGGVAQDTLGGVNQISQSCDMGSTRGCVFLGEAFLWGYGEPKDAARAADLFKRGCDGGWTVGCDLLSQQYSFGVGVPKDPTRAHELIAKSCSMGDQGACAAEQGKHAETEAVSAKPEANENVDSHHMWRDPSTGLIWMRSDNRTSIDPAGAAAYCRDSRLGGFSDWILPSVPELRTIYDAAVTLYTPPVPHEIAIPGVAKKVPKGGTWVYHIKGEIKLTRPMVMTRSTLAGAAGSDFRAVAFDFGSDKLLIYAAGSEDVVRALCVRGVAQTH